MTRIFLAPAGAINNQLLERIAEDIKSKLHADVSVIKLNFDLEAVRSPERNQYFSTRLLAQAIPQTTHYDGKILILMDADLYVPVLTFIYGEAQLRGKHSIVSSFRLHEEFYSGEVNEDLFFERLMKEVYHELGHNFGLIHCREWDCVMHSSAGIEEVDIKGGFYCSSCSAQISKALE
ncbi:MAG TPA: archaemetzincin family Zn-dependent metalloprotease [Ignavibacteriaceae bacterium]|nr:archaemetzincin family Zn-dependent metalloprotease [Ignavibacteriaceae bacterium]